MRFQVGEQLEQIVSPVGSAPLSPGSTAAVTSFGTDIEHQSCSASSSSSDSGVCDTLHFFAVYDGHGGIEAAQHCSTRLHFHLSKAMDTLAPGDVQHNAMSMTGSSVLQCQAEWTLCHHGSEGEEAGQGTSPPCDCDLGEGLTLPSGADTGAGSPPEHEPSAFNDNASSGSGGDSTTSPANVTHMVEDALREAFLRTDAEFAADGCAAMVGSTAVVALVGSKKMWIANCGAWGSLSEFDCQQQ